ncbi:hypothetical protein Q5424_14365 [Conexibacter sp. JD483]|uniref:hypothetical protein n=1 Tax=unclassified Conexibacter TaxID=2627773 RepID=UPI00271ACAB2|nr:MULTISPECIES: hypothetical protein [unclassified Conexibacter]MDO8186295.1 hypothetical protein [Conexibacter sp. CPCC 205706]MDO8197500.1 hypothetical protein [Conexibacter sp. CPCC 205762]MDR9370283.1 hypothetical protein [Conexibacter sp. JD483]
MSAVEPPPPFLDALREEFARVTEADAQALADGPARRRRLARLRLPQLRVALPVTVVLLALLVGLGVTASGVLTPQPDGGGQMALNGSDRYGSELRRTLSLLEQLPAPAAALPPGLSERGLADAAIALTPPAPAADVGAPFPLRAWVVPARDEPDRLLLVVQTDTGLGGSPGLTAEDVRAGRAYLSFPDERGDPRPLVGVVPDGVERVTVHSGSRTIELPVRDNTFGAVVRVDGIDRISWSGMAGP